MLTNAHALAASVVIHLAAVAGPALSDEIAVFADGPLEQALEQIAVRFHEETGHEAAFTYAPAPVLNRRLSAGETPDVLISLSPEIEELESSAALSQTRNDIASIKLAIAARAGDDAPDISTGGALRDALLDADSIIFNNLSSGRNFERYLKTMDLYDPLASQVIVIEGPTQFEELKARNGADFGAGLLSQILEDPELQLVGPVPDGEDFETRYSAGVFASSDNGAVATSFLNHLASDEAAATFAASGAR